MTNPPRWGEAVMTLGQPRPTGGLDAPHLAAELRDLRDDLLRLIVAGVSVIEDFVARILRLP